jgi:hypothetical protein
LKGKPQTKHFLEGKFLGILFYVFFKSVDFYIFRS